MAKKFAVLGSPIAHSLSPKIHEFVFSKLSLPHEYKRFELSSGLAAFLAEHSDFSGFSVTMPLKDEAFELAIQHSPVAIKTRSVNTLLKSENGYHGYNTDVYGIQQAVGFQPASVAVLGSGATARSALAAFPEAKKFVFARNLDAAAKIAEEFGAIVVDFEDALEAELVVSTLPAGVLPELIPAGIGIKTLLDVAYTNPSVPCQRYVSGLEMLIQQAIAQQRIFNFGDETQELANEPELLEGLLAMLIVAK